MACESCRGAILESDKQWDYYPVPQSELHHTKTPSCLFCKTIQQDLGQSKVADKLYWWTTFERACTREIQESIAVTFRPVIQPLEKNAADEIAAARRPVRTFYVIPEDVGEIRRPEEFGDFTGSELALKQLETWIQDCDAKHSRCKRWLPSGANGANEVKQDSRATRNIDPAPRRLVDVGVSESDTAYIVDLKKSPHDGNVPRYCTLSYCWGDDPSKVMQLTPAKEEQFMDKNRGMGDLQGQKTFQHAIAVVRRLKVRYIWIDALCIIQGDGGDFATEGPKMHTIYRNTYCNIAAAASSDGSGGLYRPCDEQQPRSARQIMPTSFTTTKSSKLLGPGPWLILSADLWEEKLLRASPLYGRGWVFQERMLSTRIVHFASQQMFWDCRSISACESFPSGLPSPLDALAAADRHWRERLQYKPGDRTTGTADDSLETFWRLAVRNYTSCNLSYQKDKFNAIWGIAKVVGDVLGQTYGAGLWSKNMADQLAWKVTEPGKAERPKDLYQNPTWSWASVKGVIGLHSRLPEDWEKVATNHQGGPIACKLEIRDDNTQPVLTETALAIRSSLVEVQLVQTTAERKWTIAFNGTKFEDGKLDAFLDLDLGIDDKTQHNIIPQRVGMIGHPSAKKQECHFALLLAGGKAHRPRILRPPWLSTEEHDEDSDARWSGHGLILKSRQDRSRPTFQRVGMFRFHNLERQEWRRVSVTTVRDFQSPTKPVNEGEDVDIFVE